ncbi:MAG: hypothetical protein A2046_01985 [Bacteroidetes bacterium GWA2_30_7]|nr:MAG: hypothetical protein A2046_01985 [Bacteroidetes bacterium GWA2_30_7]
MQKKYYLDSLYPLQNEILSIVQSLNNGFYLTGGTALSRFYFNHRFSDDLDFFINNDANFKDYIKLFAQEFSKKYKSLFELGLLEDSFSRMSIKGSNCILKLDFVNDIPIHFGSFNKFPLFNTVDNQINILSNKISALPRNSAKDIVDIIYISQNNIFNWKDIITNAQDKDMWVNPIDAASIIDTFPFDLFDEIKWIKKPDYNKLFEHLKIIAKEILLGDDNSLMK